MAKGKSDPKPVSPNVNRVIVYDPINRRTMYLDPVDGGVIPTIELDHSMIHRERFFTASIKEEKLKPSTPKYIYLKTSGNKNEAHLKGAITVTKPTYVNLYENPSVTDNGTPIPIFNNDRNSLQTSNLKIYKDPTFNGFGRLYLPAYITSKGEPKNETILKRNTGYLAEVKPTQNNTTVIIVFTWYEAPIGK